MFLNLILYIIERYIESSGCKRYEPSILEKELDREGHLGQKYRQTAVEDALCAFIYKIEALHEFLTQEIKDIQWRV